LLQDDRAEIDVEIVTRGDSLVNDTMNWTTHPSLDAAGLPIFGATVRVPLDPKFNGTNIREYHEYRFDYSKENVKYFLDGTLVHEDLRPPPPGGNLQLKLWADGNMWWSGKPSSTTVTMSVQNITAHFNLTEEPKPVAARSWWTGLWCDHDGLCT
jgi:beta-glucanase (GH16 family)